MEPRIKPKTLVSSPSMYLLLNKYQLGSFLGSGSFAKVFHAQSLIDETHVAIKVIKKSSIIDTPMEPRILREIYAMHRLNHPNIIKIHEVLATKKKIFLVMEYAEGGDLYSKVLKHGPFPEPVARRCFQQLVKALHFCHVNGITHRDIKPHNLLLDHEGNLKISDFGLSALPEQFNSDGLLHTSCGTPGYSAPEVGIRGAYDGSKADAWSCGIILFVFLAGYMPFDDSNIILMYRKIYRKDYQFPSWFSRSVKYVISKLLDPNPDTRMSLEKVMETSCFNKKSPKTNRSMIKQSIALEKKVPKEFKFEGSSKVMNAFDIISMSSGLDLSGLFEGGRRREKIRFTTTTFWEKIVERVEESGKKLGYNIGGKKGGVIELGKGRLSMLIEVLVITPSLFLVEMKVCGGDQETDFEEAFLEELKASGLENVEFSLRKYLIHDEHVNYG